MGTRVVSEFGEELCDVCFRVITNEQRLGRVIMREVRTEYFVNSIKITRVEQYWAHAECTRGELK